MRRADDLSQVLTSTHTSLQSRLRRQRCLTDFNIGRATQPVLAQFCRPMEVVAFLNSNVDAEARSAVTKALIAETQLKQASCWLEILIVAFHPWMLRQRLALDDRRPGIPGELDQLILDCFVEAVHGFPITTQGEFAVVNLTRNAGHAVTRQLVREVKLLAKAVSMEEDETKDQYGSLQSLQKGLDNQCQANEAAAESLRLLGLVMNHLTEGERRLLDAHFSDKPLIDWVREQYPDASDEEFRGEYERARRARSRLLLKVRAFLKQNVSHEKIEAALWGQEV